MMNGSFSPPDISPIRKIFWATVFGAAMAFIESAVVVYLRAIYYPEGFSFPLQPVTDTLIGIEVIREAATLFLLVSVAAISAQRFRDRFSFFLFCFAVWDIFYYIWLKVLIDWPSTLFEWDILFLIPLPWIGPVIAPVSISLLMIIFSVSMMRSFSQGYEFKPLFMPKILALAGTCSILYSFMRDIDAGLHQKFPQPYHYELLIIGELLYIAAFMISHRNRVRRN
jgi:flagellar biosynthesis protein FliQ